MTGSLPRSRISGGQEAGGGWHPPHKSCQLRTKHSQRAGRRQKASRKLRDKDTGPCFDALCTNTLAVCSSSLQPLHTAVVHVSFACLLLIHARLSRPSAILPFSGPSGTTKSVHDWGTEQPAVLQQSSMQLLACKMSRRCRLCSPAHPSSGQPAQRSEIRGWAWSTVSSKPR